VHNIYERQLTVCRAQSKPTKENTQESRRLYLDNNASEEELRHTFAPHGTVTDVYLPRHTWKTKEGPASGVRFRCAYAPNPSV
jgi:hypothetical protein